MIEPAGELTLLERVEEYLRRHRMPATRFGKIVVTSPSLVGRMRAGKSLRRTTVERIEAQLLSPPRPMTLGQFKAKRYRVAMQEQVRADLAERDRRLTDPCEQAATLLRSRGWRVFRTTWDGDDGETVVGWFVGRMQKNDDDMKAMARRNGWRGADDGQPE